MQKGRFVYAATPAKSEGVSLISNTQSVRLDNSTVTTERSIVVTSHGILDLVRLVPHGTLSLTGLLTQRALDISCVVRHIALRFSSLVRDVVLGLARIVLCFSSFVAEGVLRLLGLLARSTLCLSCLMTRLILRMSGLVTQRTVTSTSEKTTRLVSGDRVMCRPASVLHIMLRLVRLVLSSASHLSDHVSDGISCLLDLVHCCLNVLR
jgi:hypothetical protein